PSIAALEKELAAYLNVKHVISCNSGTDALWLAVHALNVQPNEIVLTTPFSFIASASELIPHGAHPVFIDIDPVTYNIDPVLMRSWLETQTKQKDGRTIHRATGYPVVGMIPVHIFGQCADMDSLLAIAKEFNLWVIEDTAQAIGSTLNGKFAGTMGDIGTLSFYPTKNLGAFGDAGCMVTNDTTLAEKLVRLRNHGRKNHYQYECYGLNSRLDAMQAEVLRIKLKLVDSYNQRRRSIAAQYDEALQHVSYIQIPQAVQGTHTYHQYSIVIKPEVCGMTRDAIAQNLEAFGIGTRVFYPQPLPAIDYLRTHEELQTLTPVAHYLTHNILALPIWPEMTKEQINHVIEALSSFPVIKQEVGCATTL
ncbi:DegT/DnrJ/EryC1/StrS family aminotransferase, partial [Candidatus Dependentiae bacterium]|nr:DegT/DnrJ/EryC1/StrS family aminotransferase [Candidatus Dependentiae bacterium]